MGVYVPKQRPENIRHPGDKIGRWTLIERYAQQRAMWRCACDCGGTGCVPENRLLRGGSLSCGCLHREFLRRLNVPTHGDAKPGKRTAEYQAWINMRARCYSSNNHAFPDYGGRGITVCDEWLASFPAFLKHIGRRPTPAHSIDRIDVNGNYEPGNVRWATRQEQCENRRSNRWITHDGRTQLLLKWAAECGMEPATLRDRLRRGWSITKALTLPIGQRSH